MNDYLNLYIKIGVDSTVRHQDGKGDVEETEGTLLNPDDKGYVVIKLSDGKMRYIPKEKVIDISEN